MANYTCSRNIKKMSEKVKNEKENFCSFSTLIITFTLVILLYKLYLLFIFIYSKYILLNLTKLISLPLRLIKI